MEFLSRIEHLWDRGAAHARRHPRKYLALGGVMSMIPLPDIARVLWEWLPDVPVVLDASRAMWQLPNVSLWQAFAMPIWAILCAAVWREAKKATVAKGETSNPLSRDNRIAGQTVEPLSVQQALADADALYEQASHYAEVTKRLTTERDELKAELQKARLEWAMEHVGAMADMRFGELEPRVTIRFASYAGGDYELAAAIRDLLNDAGWRNVELDGTNNPALQPEEQFKVVFASGYTASFDRLAYEFQAGDLLGGVSIGANGMQDGQEPHHLAIEVRPSRGAA